MALIDACKKLNEENIPFECLFVGEGVLQAELERRIQEYGLSQKVLGAFGVGLCE